MGRGIKTSRASVADVIYEPFGGLFYDENEIEDFYIVGVGIERLPELYHDYAYADEINNDLEVYLESEEAQLSGDYNTWNKKFIDKKFSDPITKISEDEFDDLKLHAKWVQYLYKGTYKYESWQTSQDCLLLKKDDVLFSWTM